MACACRCCAVCTFQFDDTERGQREPENPAVCVACYERREVSEEEAERAGLNDIAGWGLEWAWDRSGHEDAATMLLDSDPPGAAAAAAGVLVGWFLRVMVPLAAGAGEREARARFDRAAVMLGVNVGTYIEETWSRTFEEACAAARALGGLEVGRALRLVGAHEEAHRATLGLRAYRGQA